MMRATLFMAATLVLMITMFPVAGLTEENRGDQMKKFMESTTPAERADVQTRLMAEMLSLSDEQAEQVKAVNLKYAKQAAEIFNSEESRFGKFRKMRKMAKDKDEELQAVLTNEQYDTYAEAKKEIRDKTMETLRQE